MTAEEAKMICDLMWQDDIPCSYISEVRESLEKQIPKKPIREDSHVVPWYICPSCGKLIADRYQGIKSDHHYCSVCGQLLDWKDEIKNM